MRSCRSIAMARGGRLAAAALVSAALWCSTAHAELAAAMRMASLDLPGATTNASEAPGEQVIARVDLSNQKMMVFVGDKLAHEFTVSTGREGFDTPTGRYQVQWIHPKWRSRTYNMAPMPWSVFFHGGYAVHGTTDLRRLGRPASHGCVRLDPKDAKTFYKLVDRRGLENTLVSVVR